MADLVRWDIADGIARLTLCHPPANILTRAVLGEIRERVASLHDAPDVRVLLLAAEGKHFSAGADVGEHLHPTYRELIPEFVDTIHALWALPIPVVAAARGRCLGGGFELVQPADVIVAGDSASFGQPEIVLGVFPPAACVLLPRLCGAARAAEIILGGAAIGAAEAQRMGLVARVVADDAVETEALAVATQFAAHSAAALRVTKRALRAAADLPFGAGLARVRTIYTEDLMATHDANEGLEAFLAKRPATWEHQ